MSIDAAIDTMISEANPEGNKPPEVPAEKPVEAKPDGKQPEGEITGKKPENETKSDPDEFKRPWPKSAIEVMNRKDKKLAAARQQFEELQKNSGDAKWLREQLQKLEPAPQVDPNDPMPDVSKYQDWIKYNQDLTAWNLRQMQKTQAPKTENGQKPVDPQKAAWQQERVSHVTNKTREILAAHPEYVPVFQQNAELLDDLPEATKDILLSSDNAALAVLQMAHDGTLDDLPHMAAPLAQKTILSAIARGASLIGAASGQPTEGNQAAPIVSQAPAPMKTATTVKSGAKDPSKMSDAEFREAFLS